MTAAEATRHPSPGLVGDETELMAEGGVVGEGRHPLPGDATVESVEVQGGKEDGWWWIYF